MVALYSNFLSHTFFGSLLWRGFFQSCYLNLNRRQFFRWFCLLRCFLWFWFFFAFILVLRFIFHFLIFGFFRWWFSFLGWWFNLLFLLWRLYENKNGKCSHWVTDVCLYLKSASTSHSLNNEIVAASEHQGQMKGQENRDRRNTTPNQGIRYRDI